MVIPTITPIVPPITASAPLPKLTSASSRTISRGYRLNARGIQASVRRLNRTDSPSVSKNDSRRSRVWATRCRTGVVVTASHTLRRHELQVHGRQHEVDEEQQQEREDDRLVHGVADAFRPGGWVQTAVGGDDAGDEPEDQRFD